MKEVFPHVEVRHFYLLGFVAFIWQFGLKNRSLFKLSLKLLGLLDNILLAVFPRLKNHCWFFAIHIQKPTGDTY